MQRRRVEDLSNGLRLARPARTSQGDIVLPLGTSLDREHIQHLEQMGIAEVLVVQTHEDIPEPSVPEYMDRYEPEFASHIEQVFKGHMSTKVMQELYLRALGHASSCYQRYRLDDEVQE